MIISFIKANTKGYFGIHPSLMLSVLMPITTAKTPPKLFIFQVFISSHLLPPMIISFNKSQH